MGNIPPFRKPPAGPRWTRPEAYLARRKTAPDPRKAVPERGRGFAALLVGLPLAAFTAVWLMPLSGGPEEAAASSPAAPERTARSAADLDAEQPQIAGRAAGGGTADRENARFGLCSGPVRVTCVVDGDTIWYRGTKIRIADVDTPEVSKPACANEAALGRKATVRLQALLNAGPFTLAPNPFGDSVDRYGRSLLLVTRGGESLGAVLVREGLAEQWGGPRRAWC
jgi:endonuclease YncB( thermonuclease family)